jgi:hypothetical protein
VLVSLSRAGPAAARQAVNRPVRKVAVFCPVCGDEYRTGFTRCDECEVALVEALEPASESTPFELTTVLETGDQSLAVVVRSVLESAGIPSIARNERLQNLLGWGSIGTGYSVAMGPIRIQVLREDEEVARELLKTVPLAVEDEDGDG